MLSVAKKLVSYLKVREATPLNEKLSSWSRVVAIAKRKRRQRQFRAVSVSVISAAAIVAAVMMMNYFPRTDSQSINTVAEQLFLQEEHQGIVLTVADNSIPVDNFSEISYSDSGELFVNSLPVSIKENLSKEKFGNKKNLRHEYNQLIVPKGKRITLTLSDRTKVWVNSGTRIVYPQHFKKNIREIFVDGEVFLEVAKNERCPFVVKTNAGFDVKVLGTSFNLCTYNTLRHATVVLAEGSIEVKDAWNKKSVLKPNELITISNNQLGCVQTVNACNYYSWTRGVLNLRAQSLIEVLNRLSIYFGASMEIDSSLENLKISGDLALKESLDNILAGLKNIVPLNYRVGDDGKYYLTK